MATIKSVFFLNSKGGQDISVANVAKKDRMDTFNAIKNGKEGLSLEGYSRRVGVQETLHCVHMHGEKTQPCENLVVGALYELTLDWKGQVLKATLIAQP